MRLADSGAAIEIVPGKPAVLLPASASWIVKENVPEPVGLPETEPSWPSASPLGRAPELTVQVYGASPPVAERATGA
jgi:hypothetical protein